MVEKNSGRSHTQGTIDRFGTLFAGLDRVHGMYVLDGTLRSDNKREGRGAFKRNPDWPALWEKHLAGEQSLGVVPIRDDATCVFGAIDVDAYQNFDLSALAAKIAELNLPLVLCRSKSGGAHIYAFAGEPVAAEIMRARLSEMAAALGHSGAEIFPVQNHLVSKDDCGSFINMPYFQEGKDGRYALRPDGSLLTVAEFLDFAESMKQPVEFFNTPIPATDGELFSDGPPCLQRLAKEGGFKQGQWQTLMYSVAVYCKKSGGEDWQGKLIQINDKVSPDPVAGRNELKGVIDSVKRHANYNYKCKQEPLKSTCQSKLCVQRPYGIEPDDEYQYPPVTIQEVKAEAIANTIIPEMKWCVKNLVPGDGVAVIAGRPKAGKSFFDLQLALAVASGRKFLNRFETTETRVLYLALEDSVRRIKSRMEMVNAQKEAQLNLAFSFGSFRFSPQGIGELERVIDKGKYGLVIIDPLFATRTGQKGSSKNAVQADYDHAKLIHDIAVKHQCGILATHHTKKPIKGDAAGVFDQIQDTTGLQAAIDAMMVLEAVESSGENARRFRLSVTGKDVECGDALSLLFDPGKLSGWTMEGLAKFTQIKDTRQAVLRILKRDKTSTAKKISIELQKEKSGIQKLLNRMQDDGLVASDNGTYWPVIPDEEQMPFDMPEAA